MNFPFVKKRIVCLLILVSFIIFTCKNAVTVIADELDIVKIKSVEKCVNEFLKILPNEMKSKKFSIVDICPDKSHNKREDKRDWLEEGIITALLSKKIIIVERDKNILEKVIFESSQIGKFEMSMEDFNYKTTAIRQSELLNADYIIAYELIDETLEVEDDIKIASIKIKFRVIDTKTGVLMNYLTTEGIVETPEPENGTIKTPTQEKAKSIKEDKTENFVGTFFVIIIIVVTMMFRVIK